MSEKFSHLDKFGVIGSNLAAFAAADPCYLPVLATAGAPLGFGLLMPYQAISEWFFQSFVLLALWGGKVAFHRHQQILPLAIMLGAAAAIFTYYHGDRQAALVYGGLASLVGASILNHRATKRCQTCKPSQSKAVILESVITCPHCGATKKEVMPTDSCMFFYECSGCHKLLRPHAGHCCVFCSYGSVPCPPIQEQSDRQLAHATTLSLPDVSVEQPIRSSTDHTPDLHDGPPALSRRWRYQHRMSRRQSFHQHPSLRCQKIHPRDRA